MNGWAALCFSLAILVALYSAPCDGGKGVPCHDKSLIRAIIDRLEARP